MDQPIDFAVIPALDGDIGIVPEHTPFFSPLREGQVKVKVISGDDDVSWESVAVKEGFVEVSANEIKILTKA